MKIVAFSSDKDFEKFYNSLCESGFEISLLVSESAKKQGRDLKIKSNPAVEFATDRQIPTVTPDTFDTDAITRIAESGANIGFVFSYGKIIPQKIIDLFTFGIINVHPSLLPIYRGPSPIQQALLDNLKETGFSIMKINSKMDAGDILFQDKLTVNQDDTFESLREKLLDRASDELPSVINMYLSGKILPIRQDDSQATVTKMISKNDGLIKDDDTADGAYNKMRAYSHWPKTFFLIDNKRFIIHGAKLTDHKLEITKIQPEGKNIMSFVDFKNGYHSLLTKFPDFVNIS